MTYPTLYLLAFLSGWFLVRGLVAAGKHAPFAVGGVPLEDNLVFALARPVAPVLGPVTLPLLPAALRERLDLLVLRAGLRGTLELQHVAAACAVWAVLTATLCLAFPAVSPSPWIGLAGATAGAALPVLWLRNRIERRQGEITRQLPFVMDLLTLAMESGLDFATALARVIPRMPAGPLQDELEEFEREANLGVGRVQALRNLAHRTDVPDVFSFTFVLIQAIELGSAISPVLRQQAERARAERFQRAERLGNEASTKMALPLLLFIVPAVLLIIAGMVVIDFQRSGFFETLRAAGM